jgi:predicted transposase/invertase (TIGR01784 family)
MKESVVYQAILNEGRREGKFEGKKEGKLEGKLEGKQEGIQEVAINLLKSGMSIEQVMSVTGFSLEKIQQLQEIVNQNNP